MWRFLVNSARKYMVEDVVFVALDSHGSEYSLKFAEFDCDE